jgi:nucleotide-binding universal stress UspA family protein
MKAGSVEDRMTRSDMSTSEGSGPHVLVVGVDDSEGSRRAVEWAAQNATRSGLEVVAVHVLTYDRELVEDLSLDTIRDWRTELAGRLRREWTAPLEGIDHRCMLVEADSPTDGLVEVVAKEQAELLVVGAHRGGGLTGRFLGGVAYRVTHRASVPVVVVPPEWSAT